MILSPQFKIYIIEKDKWFRRLLKYHLNLNPDFDIVVYNSFRDLSKTSTIKLDLLVLGLTEFNSRNTETLKKINKEYPKTPIIAIGNKSNLEARNELIELGVVELLLKGETTKEQLWESVLNIKQKSNTKEVETVSFNSKKNLIIGKSKAIKDTFNLIDKAATSLINVSISGETGTGKELVARNIHDKSSRCSSNFVAINLSSLPKDLTESELFGHEKGAFTGAASKKVGKFELANGGTLFLDEIAEVPMSTQSKLLRALEEREISRIGSNSIIELDIRVITATHKNLYEEVEKGNFREDLYYRLIGLNIELPPLQNRIEDILLLSNFFIEKYCLKNRTDHITLSNEALKKLKSHNYPGNIRELKSIIELACVICEDNTICTRHVSFIKKNNVNRKFEINKTLKEHTLDIIKQYLVQYRNNVVETSKALGIGKSTIYKMIKAGELDI